jgi:LuxR family transcriptional regulator, maltose regulon positive regulatory protein
VAQAGLRGAPLLRTKIELPVARELVSRRELLGILTEGAPRKLTLIRAPAGWGKTTLLSEWGWAAGEGRRFAWLALEEADSEPVRFWSYLIGALRTAAPGLGEESLALLRAPGVSLEEEMLPTLVNEIADSEQEMLLAVDDYHLVESDEIHEEIVFLLEHLPANLRLAIAARSEPPFPVARLRARGELREIDTGQLRFSASEAEELVNGVHELGLEPGDVARLCERTEGWPAGLYLAVLSLLGRADPGAFIAGFAGDDRHVVDYLGAEVLAGLPDEVRVFLRRTSILDRFCGALCDAVTDQRGGAELLARIERSNYFLVPLDTRREWYRYHHLFGELLRHELRSAEPELIPDLHRRAALWLADAGLVSEAIHHAVAAGELSHASELIAEHWLAVNNTGDRGTVLGWLDALPEEAVLADGRLCLARGWTLLAAGRTNEALPWADAAKRAQHTPPFRDGTISAASGAACLRTSYWAHCGDVDKARRFAQEVMRHEQTGPWRGAPAVALGRCAYWLDEKADAVEHFEEAVRVGGGLKPRPLSRVIALGYLALVAIDRGDWEQAARRVDDALGAIAEAGADEYWMASMAHLARGRLLERQGEPAAAGAELERGLTLARRGAPSVTVIYGLVALARARNRAGDRARARALVVDARRTLETLPEPLPLAVRLVEDAERQLQPAPGVAGSFSEELSGRELAVLRLFPSDLSQREIGGELYISLNTVKTHTKHILRKLDASSRREAVERARDLGLL